jgi:uncharacterized protein YwgA
MFLFSRDSGAPSVETYDFVPYDYGPFSVAIYADLDALYDAGLIDRLATPGYTWARYQSTASGIVEAQRLVDAMDRDDRSRAVWLQRLKQDVLGKNFRDLLRYVYDRYPEFAENSVFRG